jgi:hypothetical protein
MFSPHEEHLKKPRELGILLKFAMFGLWGCGVDFDYKLIDKISPLWNSGESEDSWPDHPSLFLNIAVVTMLRRYLWFSAA